MVVTRFAPSPTGFLHIGGLRTALYNYLYARANGGKFLLRIEDTDLKRNSKEAAIAIAEAFKWCNLDFDGEIVYQSQRFDLYKEYINKLLLDGKAYRCYMSMEELEELRSKQKQNNERPRYNGMYRDFNGIPPSGIEPVIRIKSPMDGVISFDDGVKGNVKFNCSDILDDFVIARADGTPTYNFTVVIDDALMGVTDVIRGDDHLSNTPKQIVLYNALGFSIPKFYHVAMINGSDGSKLSKRHGATDVMEYRKMGYLPQALLNFLVRLGWSHGDDEIFSVEQLKQIFNPKHISKSCSTFNQTKLDWLNAHYIKESKNSDLLKFINFDITHVKNVDLLINCVKQRCKTIIELIDGVKSIILQPQEYDKKSCDKFLNDDSINLLCEFCKDLSKEDISKTHEFENFTNNFLNLKGKRLKDLAQPVRIAITGSSVSPGIFEMMEILGIKESVLRIQAFLNAKLF